MPAQIRPARHHDGPTEAFRQACVDAPTRHPGSLLRPDEDTTSHREHVALTVLAWANDAAAMICLDRGQHYGLELTTAEARQVAADLIATADRLDGLHTRYDAEWPDAVAAEGEHDE